MDRKLIDIMAKIVGVTNVLKTQYPELYRNLDEDPSTLSYPSCQDLDQSDLLGYLDSLQELLGHYKQTHAIAKT